MGIIFTSPEIVEIAIRIEEDGEKFYSKMKEKVEGEETKSLFDFLSKQEKQHIKDFRKLYNLVKNNRETIVGDEEEFALYMRAYMDTWTIDTFKKRTSELNPEEVDSILRFAIDFEKETILFYYGMRDRLSSNAAPIVNNIIEQERRHITILKNFLRDRTGDVDELLYSSLESELLAKKFYEEAEAKAESNAGKKFFKELAQFEQVHYDRIKKIIEARKNGEKLEVSPATKVIDKVTSEVQGEFEPNKDEIADVLILAIDAEKTAAERNKKIVERVENVEEKKIFENLADEERKHQRILEDEFYQISNRGVFIWGD